jgi:SCP-2 sterol transfer family/Mycothiol maleylpyruvate isomerase N-terminal domain
MDPTTVLSQARSALEVTAGRTARLIRPLPDLDGRIPGSVWTVREAAVHLVNHAGLHTEIAEGLASPIASVAREALAAENSARIADIPAAGGEQAAALLTDAVAGLLEATANRSGHQPVQFHAGLSLDLAALVCISLGEQLLHGYDIATALGVPWPIEPAQADLVIHGYGPYFGCMVDPELARGVTSGFGIDLRGGSSFTVRFDDGGYRLEPPRSGPVDCTISADPVAFLLMWSGRMSPWEAIALNLYVVDGKEPSLGLRFMELFTHP